jgi:hypothetical protein
MAKWNLLARLLPLKVDRCRGRLAVAIANVTSTGIEESTSNGSVETSLRIGKGARVFATLVEGAVRTFFLGILLV